MIWPNNLSNFQSLTVARQNVLLTTGYMWEETLQANRTKLLVVFFQKQLKTAQIPWRKAS